MADELQELCEDILDNVEDAASCVLEEDYPEPGESDDVLRTHLEETLERIDAALNELGGVAPAATAQPLPETLPELAERCRDVARDLFAEEGVLLQSEEDLRAQLTALRTMIDSKPGGFLDQAEARQSTTD
jgi:hypothetical protein